MRTLVVLTLLASLSIIAKEDKSNWGKLWVRSDPTGAKVSYARSESNKIHPYEHEQQLGKTPCLIRLPMGNHNLFLDKENHIRLIATHTITTKNIVKTKVYQLFEEKRAVDVIFDKPGWTIYVDGEVYKENGKPVMAPATIKVSDGEHKIELRKGKKAIHQEYTSGNIVDLSQSVAKDAPIEDIGFDNITAEQWNEFRGLLFNVFATKPLDTKITLSGQEIIVLPHPDDKWKGNPRGKEVDYRGYVNSTGNIKINSLCCKIGSKKYPYGIIKNAHGRLILQINGLGNNADNSGSIRVKIGKR